MPLAHPPGHAQADFGEAIVIIGGVERKAHFFVMDLPHSDACFVRAYPAATAEAWVDGHVHAFAFFGRAPLSVLYETTAAWSRRSCPTGRGSGPRSSAGSCRIICSATATGAPARAMTRARSRGWWGRRAATSWCRSRSSRPGTRSTLTLRSGVASVRQMSCAARPDDRATPRTGSGRDVRTPCGAVRCLRPGHRTVQFPGAGALQDQRLLGPGRLRPSRRLDPGLCRRGRDRLRRRHRKPSALLRPRGHGLRSHP